MKLIYSSLFAACLAFLSAGQTAVFAQATPDPAQAKAVEKTKSSAASDGKKPGDSSAEKAVAPNRQRYRIGFEDVLSVTVYRHPELSQTLTVAQDGTIVLPRIDGPIIAVCKTERQLAALVTALYKNYLRDPFVNVRALERKSQPFAVMGAVNKPGSFFLNRKVRLLELLAFAGGPDVEKAGRRIQVARVGNQSACLENDTTVSDVEFMAYNINDVLGGKENPWMQPGDIVSILVAEEAYVVGAVYEPTKIVLMEPITLTQAIAKAGGISSTAKTSKVRIQRQKPGSPIRTELVFDLKDIRKKRIADPWIEPNDIVEVPTDSGKVLKRGIFKVLAGGLSNLFYGIPL